MRRSESIEALAAALVAFQIEVPKVSKTNTAEVVSRRTGGKFSYKYADLADVMNAAIPVMAKHGLCIVQGFVNGCVQTELLHSSGQWIGDDGIPLPLDIPPQEVGGAITYFRRYGACSITGIAPEEDDDAAGAQKAATSRVHQQLKASVNPDAEDDDLSFLNDDRPPQEVAVAPKNPANKPAGGSISEGQVKRLWAIAKSAGKGKDAVLTIIGQAGYENAEDISWKKYNEIIEKIQA